MQIWLHWVVSLTKSLTNLTRCLIWLIVKSTTLMQKNTFNKHETQNVTPIVNTKSKLQHQLFAIEHKTHVHQIPKIATLESKMQQCTMLQRHDHKFYTQWRSYLEVVTNKLAGGDNYLLELGVFTGRPMAVHWLFSWVKCLQLATQASSLKYYT